jgi:hypothetical protein
VEIVLDEVEVRALGCLIEKEMATPEHYPLTLNSLTNACNQKSNRDPVSAYEEAAVERAAEGLREKGLATVLREGRTPKYMHSMVERFDLERPEVALLCELMLRGPQTAGELKGHAARLYGFKGIEEVEDVLKGLIEREQPFVIKLPRRPGRKEPRYMHLLAGEPEVSEGGQEPMKVSDKDDRVLKLEEDVAALRDELDELRKAFNDLKAAFHPDTAI